MKNLNTNLARKSAKAAALGLLMSALVPTGAALAHGSEHGHSHRGPDVSGTVVVTKQIPGGVVTVGATIGRPRPVVVEERRVVVVEKQAPRKVVVVHKHEPARKVVVVHKHERPRKVVVVHKHKQPEKVVIVKDRRGHDRHDWRDRRDDRRRHGRDHGHRQVSYHRQDESGSSHYYRDANQVSKSYSGPDGNYHYYEDANQVSIQDNRGGQARHVYVRK
jgi:hypothetical protein